MFSMQPVSKHPCIATLQLSSAASLYLEQSQIGILGKGLNPKTTNQPTNYINIMRPKRYFDRISGEREESVVFFKKKRSF